MRSVVKNFGVCFLFVVVALLSVCVFILSAVFAKLPEVASICFTRFIFLFTDAVVFTGRVTLKSSSLDFDLVTMLYLLAPFEPFGRTIEPYSLIVVFGKHSHFSDNRNHSEFRQTFKIVCLC